MFLYIFSKVKTNFPYMSHINFILDSGFTQISYKLTFISSFLRPSHLPLILHKNFYQIFLIFLEVSR